MGDIVASIMTGNFPGYSRTIATTDIGYTDSEGSSLLQIAIAYRREEIALDLIKRGASVNNRSKDGMNELQMALFQGLFIVAEKLLQHGVDVKNIDKYGNQALWYASTHPSFDLSLVERILEMGGDPFAKNAAGRSAYDAATERGNSDLISLFARSEGSSKSEN